MKTILFLLFGSILVSPLHAKLVKFSVDMAGDSVSVNGMHIMGDFQQAAGFGPDWDPGTTALTREGTTNIYSIIVNIPAFRKYEYRFINGHFSYESEFISDTARVDLFNDNRWIYIDSTSNDVFDIGAIVFGKNAPAGKKLFRVRVDMSKETVSPNGAYVFFGPQNSFARLYSFGNGIYENISYHSPGTYTYGFSNGNSLPGAEVLSGSCATNGRRTVTLMNDVIADTTCFASCTKKCTGVGISEAGLDAIGYSFYPNPAHEEILVECSSGAFEICLSDVNGKKIKTAKSENDVAVKVDLKDVAPGIYFLSVKKEMQISVTRKVVVN